MAQLILENVSKVFKGARGEEIRAVNNLNLTIRDQELIVLLGPSGCGKSTTLRLIAGLEEVSGGRIILDQQDLKGIAPKDRDVGMVFQNPALYPHLSVFENMGLGLKLRKFSRPEIQQRVTDTAESVGLTDCLERKPDTLSGGQRQRVAVGRAIARKPRIFLLDEPFTNLDPPLRAQLRREITNLHTQLRTITIYVTHEQTEAMMLGGRIAVMRDGTIQQIDDPLSLYHSPANAFVAKFIGWPQMNIWHGILDQSKPELFLVGESGQGNMGSAGLSLRLTEWQLASLRSFAGKKILLGLRPEDVKVSKADHEEALQEPALLKMNTAQAQVERIEELGVETHLALKVGALLLVARTGPEPPVLSHGTVAVRFEVSKAHFFNPETGSAILTQPTNKASHE